MSKTLGECGLCRINIEDLGVKKGEQVLLEAVNLHLHCGELTALIGPNGAGKTTLLRALLGEMSYTGTIQHLQESGARAQGVRTGYVPQQLAFDRSAPVTVLDLFAAATTGRGIWLGIGKKKREEVAEVLSRTHAQDLLNRRLGALSGGELQRVLLALALWPVPDLLILDEPVSGVDATGLSMFYQTVLELRQKHHMAILLVSHDFTVVQKYADFVVLLDRRILASGTPEQVFHSDVFGSIFPGQEVSA